MENGPNRKKQPEEVRRKLLDSAASLAVEQGLASVSIQAVADAAGVTKGGLFHHFPNRQALIDAVSQDLLAQLDVEIDRHLLADKGGRGTFTRAYVRAMFDDRALGSKSPWAALTMSLIADPGSSRAWDAWLNARLVRHAATDSGTLLEVVRLAADGAWLAQVVRPDGGADSSDVALIAQLMAMTEEGA